MIASNCRPSLLQCGVLHHSRLLWSWLATVYSFSKLIVVGMQKYLLLGRQEVTALNGQHLRIASFDIRPYMHIEHDMKGHISKAGGFVYQMVLWLSKRFNITLFTLVESADGTVEAAINNTWNGMIRMAINRDVDFVAGPIVPLEARAKVIDFSINYLDEPAAILIPAPTLDQNNWVAIFKPFHYDVPKNTATRVPHSNKIAISSWCLMSAALVYAYSCCIISYLTIPRSYLLVNSVEELANSKVLQVTTLKNSIFETTLLQLGYGPFKLLGDSLRKNPGNSFSGQYYDQTRLLNKVFGRLALITGRLQLEMLIELNYRQTRRCDLTLLPQQFWHCQKDAYTHLINLGIMEIKQLELIDHWIKVYVNQTNQCSHGIEIFDHSNSKKKHPLGFSNLGGVFILFLLGISVSTLMFLSELYLTLKTKLQICSCLFLF
ncbi:Uncharacterized protein APZ42_026119 [Daphnia magna]|uniref:Ionotropic glutamate receptor L-glutamate and glycine-binding domain-containing protein n=1 Tax=Daphnia magna TaxID=35525 RepID=A0A164SHD9_9CRUS|nr:Uncharacterized protein APZ42_026119 [Daphnia magna]